MQKPYTLIIPSWYPTASKPLNGIFIEKHVNVISTFQDVVVMYVTGGQNDSKTEEIISPSYIRWIYIYAESSGRAINQLRYLITQMKAYSAITSKYGRPSKIHLHVAFPAGIFVYLLLLFKNIPLIITEHWSGYTAEDGRYARQAGIIKYMTQQLFRKARKISAVSQYLKKAIIAQGLADESKVRIASNFLNIPDNLSPLDISHPRALSVGNLNDHEKNISMLVGAVAIVVQRYPDFQLTMVGVGIEMHKFTDLAGSKGLLDKNIFFKGYVPNSQLIDVYRSHSFFILTSNFETFNIAAAEALLSGLPVVSTQCGGPAEYINANTGIWIKDKTDEDTAEAIIAMIERRSSFDAQVIADQMIDKYSREQITEELRNLYAA